MGGNHLCSADINDWLKDITAARVVHWTAVPHGEYGCRVLIEYTDEDNTTKNKTPRNKNKNNNNVQKITKEVELNLEDPLY